MGKGKDKRVNSGKKLKSGIGRRQSVLSHFLCFESIFLRALLFFPSPFSLFFIFIPISFQRFSTDLFFLFRSDAKKISFLLSCSSLRAVIARVVTDTFPNGQCKERRAGQGEARGR